jgi:VanZ family protein
MTRRLALGLFCILLALILFWTLSPVHLRPHFTRAAVERAGAFFVLAASLAAAYPRRPFLVAVVICSIAVGSEALQIFVASRDARFVDGAEKTVGGLVGVAAVALVARVRRDP